MIPKAVFAYFRERFPLINMALFAILFFTVHAVSRYFIPLQPELSIWWIVMGVLAVISFFFRLRVFDEIKDFKIDARNHPQRVLQSGRIQIKHLVILSVLGTIVEIVWSLLAGWPVLIVWAIAFGYSVLMRYEFFIGEFLNKYLLLYATTHMLVMPFIILWVYTAFHPELEILLPYYILAALSLLSGFSFEIARKIHAPMAEREGVDSYSASVGYPGSIILALVLLLAGVFVQLYLLSLINARSWAYILIGFIFFLALLFYINNFFRPSEKGLRLAEKLVSLFMLASYVSIIIEVHS